MHGEINYLKNLNSEMGKKLRDHEMVASIWLNLKMCFLQYCLFGN
ncbi:hypothetical protein SLEP1_g31729 [Rubroshorea leprosula]|uniref:Uncharacterized protein n=1 Tax=Rubroshorea leprosula TaxID=152421 RepID=A0AAV5KAV2_9ROSI|nr:hypothetical protein SLEP1_g31729 [Rubroshorea leprosula]